MRQVLALLVLVIGIGVCVAFTANSYQRPTVPLREYDPAAHAEGSVISSVIHPVTSAFTGNRRISVGHRQHRSLYYPLTSNFSCGASDTCASPFAPAIAASGDKIFITGNWIFATSTDAGSTWSIDFCCNQDVVYSPDADRFVWWRQGYFNSTATDKNRNLLAISDIGSTSISHYFIVTASSIHSSLAAYGLDYARLDVTKKYLFVTANLVDNVGNFYKSVLMRLSLAELVSGSTVNIRSQLFDYGPIVTTTGIELTSMHFAMLFGTTSVNSGVLLGYWDDSSTQPNPVQPITIPYTPFSEGTSSCVGPGSADMCFSSDSRPLAAWKAGTNVGIMWNQPASPPAKPHPYIKVVIIDTSTVALSWTSADLYSETEAFAYPGAAPNDAGKVGISFYAASPTLHPEFRVGVLGSMTQPTPQLRSAMGPVNNHWGDFTRVRPYYPDTTRWVTVGYGLNSCASASDCDVTTHAVVFTDVEPVTPPPEEDDPTDPPASSTPVDAAPVTAISPVPQAPASPTGFQPNYTQPNYFSPDFGNTELSPQAYVINTVVPAIGIAIVCLLCVLFIFCCVLKRRDR